MKRFQAAVLFLLVLIVLELGEIAVKLPTPSVRASSDRPTPVMIVTGRYGCPVVYGCVEVDTRGNLHVVVEKP